MSQNSIKKEITQYKNGEKRFQQTFSQLNSKWGHELILKSISCMKMQIQNQNEIPWHTYYNGENEKDWQRKMLVRMWRNCSSPILLVGMQNGTTTMEHSLAISLRAKHITTIWPSNSTPRILPKGNKSMCIYTDLYMMFTEALLITTKN